jgi:hypothetical protein
LASVLMAGCSQKGAPVAQPPPKDEPKSLAAHVIRGKEKQITQGEFKNIGLFYNQYNSERSGAPTLEGFKAYIKRDAAKEYQDLEDGRIVLIVTTTPASNKVLAYEKEPDLNGKHLVLMGDGSIDSMTEAQLQKALK